MGTRLQGGLISLIAVGGGDGGAIANSLAAWTLSPGKTAVIKKIMWLNRIVANAGLLVGFEDLTAIGGLFRQVLPTIQMVTGVDGEMNEEDLPICGNTPDGFKADTVVPTGSLGAIMVQTDGAAGAAPNDVQVIIEVEEH